jgi:hypothetical protein
MSTNKISAIQAQIKAATDSKNERPEWMNSVAYFATTASATSSQSSTKTTLAASTRTKPKAEN